MLYRKICLLLKTATMAPVTSSSTATGTEKFTKPSDSNDVIVGVLIGLIVVIAGGGIFAIYKLRNRYEVFAIWLTLLFQIIDLNFVLSISAFSLYILLYSSLVTIISILTKSFYLELWNFDIYSTRYYLEMNYCIQFLLLMIYYPICRK